LNVAGFIARKIAFNRQQSFSRFIIRLAIAATAISVAVMIIALAFVNGFQETVSQKVFSFWGHLRVQHYEPSRATIAEELPITYNDTVVSVLKANPDIASIHSFATKSAILKTNESIEGILFKGIDRDYDFSHMKNFLREGRWLSFTDSGYSNEIVLSGYTAAQLQLKVNDEIFIYFIQPNGQAPRPRKLKISGIFKTGIEEYDKVFAIGDLRLVRRLNDWGENDIGGYEIFLKDYTKMDAVNLSVYDHLPSLWNSRTIKEIYPNIFDWLGIHDRTRDLILVIMIVVALLNLISCLVILVLERTRMIGVLKALGMHNEGIQSVFLHHGGLIAAWGILGGLLLGLGLLLLQQKTGFIKLDEEAYYMATAPVKIIWWQVGAVCGATLLVSLVVLLLPTFIIHRVQPVKAIQFR
jgi:lipoprotein-releasing system permease protein